MCLRNRTLLAAVIIVAVSDTAGGNAAPTINHVGLASWSQTCSWMDHAYQENLMDTACQSLQAGARAATIDELVSGSITGLPATTGDTYWVVLKCGSATDAQCHGASAQGRQCIAKSSSWPSTYAPGNGWDDICCNGARSTLCVAEATPADPAGWETLYTAPGESTQGQNNWEGWYNLGSTVVSGDGKLVAYDSTPLAAIRFSDTSGTFAEFQLTPVFAGKSLLEIVRECMGSARSNDGTSSWLTQHCAPGTLTSSSGITNAASSLRIGVGDGAIDDLDWALFMLQTGNGDGDYGSGDVYAFASEGAVNPAFSGQVVIAGRRFVPDPNATSTISTTTTTTLGVMLHTFIFSHSDYVADTELSHLLSDLSHAGVAHNTFTSLSTGHWSPRGAALVVPELGKAALTLSTEVKAELRTWVREHAGRLVVCGGDNGMAFLNSIFGWGLASASGCSGCVASRSGSGAGECKLFCQGPSFVAARVALTPVHRSVVPVGAFKAYTQNTGVWAFEVAEGEGRVVYLALDWWDAERSFWPALLHFSLVVDKNRTTWTRTSTSLTITSTSSSTTTTTTSTLMATVAGWEALFVAPGSSALGGNAWSAWYHPGSTVTDVHGKYLAYDRMPLGALRFFDDSGAWAEYELYDAYVGSTLLAIVRQCMGSSRVASSTSNWVNGHCSVGALQGSAGLENVSSVLRIGVAGETQSGGDWVLFALSQTIGPSAYALGSNGRANGGFRSQVMLAGARPTGPYTTVTMTSTITVTVTPSQHDWQTLYVGAGSSSTGANSWPSWYNAGGNVSIGDGKRSAYDELPLEGILFSDLKGCFAEFRLDAKFHGWTMLQIVQHCVGTAPSNDGTPLWQTGHCTVGTLVSSVKVDGVSDVLRIGVGDGTIDSSDWALFMLLPGNGQGDFVGSSTYAFASTSRLNTGISGEVRISGAPCVVDCNGTSTLSSTGTTTLPPLLAAQIFAHSSYVDTTWELSHVTSDLDDLGVAHTTFTGVADGSFHPWGQALLMPELEKAPLTLTSSSRAQLLQWVSLGGRLVVLGGTHGVDLLNSLFGWHLAFAGAASAASAAPRDAWQCGIFCSGPPLLRTRSAVFPVTRASLPASAVAAYRTNTLAWVVEAQYGVGRVVYMGHDWHDSVRGMWPDILKLALVGSVEEFTGVTTETATTTALPQLQCGKTIKGSTQGLASLVGDRAGDAMHRFCATHEGSYTFDTCGANYDTWLRVYQEEAGLHHRVADCNDCGACGRQTVLNAWLQKDQCYDVFVDGNAGQEGDYELRATCCSRELSCNNRGYAFSKYRSSSQITCGCSCDWPYAGDTCDKCRNPADVLIDGVCVPCISLKQANFVALASSSFKWHLKYSAPACSGFVELKSYSVFRSPTWEVHDISGGNSVSFTAPSCSASAALHDCQVSLYANSQRVAYVLSTARITCEASAAAGTKEAGAGAVHIHFFDRNGVAAQSVLSFIQLMSQRTGRVPTVQMTSFAATRVDTLVSSATALEELQDAINDMLSPLRSGFAVPQYACPLSATEASLLDKVSTELLVLAGDVPLCDSLNTRLQNLVHKGTRILWLGQAVTAPSYAFGVSVPQTSIPGKTWHPEICRFIQLFEQRGAASTACTPGTLTYSPFSVRALERTRISLKGICSVQACCVGTRCSKFVDPRPSWLACNLPLLDVTGRVNLTVVLQDGTRLVAAQPLVVEPVSRSYRVQRPTQGWNLVQGVFREYVNYVTIQQTASLYSQSGTAEASVCCQFVAIGLYDYAVMGSLSEAKCFRSARPGAFLGTMPIPSSPSHGMSELFPQPLRMVALRCYHPAAASTRVFDGTNSFVEGKGSGAGAPASPTWTISFGSTTWNREQRIDGYLKYLAENVGSASGQAMRAVRHSLEAVGLRSHFPREQKSCGEDDPDFTGSCYWAWCAHAKDAGMHLQSAGFTAISTDWSLSNALRGDVAVLPAFSGTDPVSGKVVSFPSGDIAVRRNDSEQTQWISDFEHDFEGVRQLVSLDSSSTPVLYRLLEDVQLPPEAAEQIIPVPVLDEIVTSTNARQSLVENRVELEAVSKGSVSAASAFTRYQCPAVWERYSTMPRELRPNPATWRSKAQYRCLEMAPTAARGYGVRCCYSQDNRYIPGWPSRLLVTDTSKPAWQAVEEEGMERVAYMGATGRRLAGPNTQQVPLQMALLATGVKNDHTKSSNREMTGCAQNWEHVSPPLCGDPDSCVHWFRNTASGDCAFVFGSSESGVGSWLNDMNAVERTLRTKGGLEYRVHGGFLRSFEALGDVHSWIGKKVLGCSLLHFAGHSMGGALASLAYVEYAAFETAYLHTFGQPRVFKDSPPFSCVRAKRYYLQGSGCSDCVTTQPGDSLGFQHVGLPVAVLESGGTSPGSCDSGGGTFSSLAASGPASSRKLQDTQGASKVQSQVVRIAQGVKGVIVMNVPMITGQMSSFLSCCSLHSLEKYVTSLLAGIEPGDLCATANDPYLLLRPVPPGTNNPFDTDSGYTPRRPPGFGWGDPHCSTFDGFSFECNYAGSAVLTECGQWAVHAIASKVSADGNATVITRVAVRSATDTFIGVMTEESETGFEMFLNGKPIEDQSDTLTVTLTNRTAKVEDPLGNTVDVTFHAELITLEIAPSEACYNRTMGLMGNNNADPSDDLQIFNSSEVLSPNSSAEDIYSAFILSWCVTDVGQSLFPIELFVPGDLSFQPDFIPDLGSNESLSDCPAACEGVPTCCFDVKKGGEKLIEASLEGKKKQVESVEETIPFTAKWPPKFLEAPIELMVPSSLSDVSLVAEYTAVGDDLAMVDLACSICSDATPEHELNCSVTGIGEKRATLSMRARSLPLGHFSCVATDAAGTRTQSETTVLLMPTTTTTSTSTASTSTVSTSTVTTRTRTMTSSTSSTSSTRGSTKTFTKTTTTKASTATRTTTTRTASTSTTSHLRASTTRRGSSIPRASDTTRPPSDFPFFFPPKRAIPGRAAAMGARLAGLVVSVVAMVGAAGW